jgi:predicted aspartyl protease
MSILKSVLGFLFVVTLLSCGGEKKTPIYEDVDNEEEVGDSTVSEEAEPVVEEPESPSLAESGEEVVVPFKSKDGVKCVQVSVNGVGLEMIFDTGCSSTLISVAEARYLYDKGKLTNDDIIGVSQSQIADGSIVENMVVNLKEVVINGEICCPNVQATVSSSVNAPLLLGNEVLDRVATIQIDNEREALIFNLK